MNKKSFFAGIIVGIVLAFMLIIVFAWLDEKYHLVNNEKIVNVEDVDLVLVDTTLLPSINMSDEEFTKEMMGGVQGDFTLEQVDSMQREWARLDSIKSIKP